MNLPDEILKDIVLSPSIVTVHSRVNHYAD